MFETLNSDHSSSQDVFFSTSPTTLYKLRSTGQPAQLSMFSIFENFWKTKNIFVTHISPGLFPAPCWAAFYPAVGIQWSSVPTLHLILNKKIYFSEKIFENAWEHSRWCNFCFHYLKNLKTKRSTMTAPLMRRWKNVNLISVMDQDTNLIGAFNEKQFVIFLKFWSLLNHKELRNIRKTKNVGMNKLSNDLFFSCGLSFIFDKGPK